MMSALPSPVMSVAATRHAAGEARIIGEEAADDRGEGRSAGSAEDFDVRSAAGTRSGDHIDPAVAVHVARRHEHAAGEARVIGEETAQRVAWVMLSWDMEMSIDPGVADQRDGAVEHADVRPAAGTGCR